MKFFNPKFMKIRCCLIFFTTSEVTSKSSWLYMAQFLPIYLMPKGPNVHGVAKPILGRSLDLNLILDSLKLFVNMRLAISFT
jgi:hypothetical protein